MGLSQSDPDIPLAARKWHRHLTQWGMKKSLWVLEKVLDKYKSFLPNIVELTTGQPFSYQLGDEVGTWQGTELRYLQRNRVSWSYWIKSTLQCTSVLDFQLRSHFKSLLFRLPWVEIPIIYSWKHPDRMNSSNYFALICSRSCARHFIYIIYISLHHYLYFRGEEMEVKEM